MLRYIKHNLTEITGIEIYPIISLLIFVLFFTVVIWRTMRMTKSEVSKFSNIPLEEEISNEDQNIQKK